MLQFVRKLQNYHIQHIILVEWKQRDYCYTGSVFDSQFTSVSGIVSPKFLVPLVMTVLIIRMYAGVNRNPTHYFFLPLFVIYFTEVCSVFLSFLCIHCHVSTIQIKSLAAYLGIAGHGLMHPCMHCLLHRLAFVLFISGRCTSYCPIL